MGSLKPATVYLERALAEYDPERDREVRFAFGQDTKAWVAAIWLVSIAAISFSGRVPSIAASAAFISACPVCSCPARSPPRLRRSPRSSAAGNRRSGSSMCMSIPAATRSLVRCRTGIRREGESMKRETKPMERSTREPFPLRARRRVAWPEPGRARSVRNPRRKARGAAASTAALKIVVHSAASGTAPIAMGSTRGRPSPSARRCGRYSEASGRTWAQTRAPDPREKVPEAHGLPLPGLREPS
jgi:hypothetical protein